MLFLSILGGDIVSSSQSESMTLPDARTMWEKLKSIISEDEMLVQYLFPQIIRKAAGRDFNQITFCEHIQRAMINLREKGYPQESWELHYVHTIPRVIDVLLDDYPHHIVEEVKGEWFKTYQ